jgi:hypothetical protein
VEAIGASMTPCIDGGHANEVEPRLEDTPNGATLIPGGGTSDDVMSVLGPLILWTWELVCWGCQATPEHRSCPPTEGK